MESYRMVLPEHLNHYGKLMGGRMLHWVDEVAWCAARLEFPDCDFVTVGLDRVAFHRAVPPGAVLRFAVERSRRGTTSLTYGVRVTLVGDDADDPVLTTAVTVVRVDRRGDKLSLPAT